MAAISVTPGLYVYKLVVRLLYLDTSFVDFLKDKRTLTKLDSEARIAVGAAKALGKSLSLDDIEKWLEESDNILKDAPSLENKILEETKGFSSLCPKSLSQFNLRKKVAKKSKAIGNLLSRRSFMEHVITAVHSSRPFVSSKSWNSAYNNIMEALEDNNVSILALFGVAGVGKTTLVREVAKKALQLKLFDKVIMISVGKDANPLSIQRLLLTCLGLPLNPTPNIADRAEQLIVPLKKIERVLIVLDDVWENPYLERIGIPYGEDHPGCKILLATRSIGELRSSMKLERMVQLDVLDEDDAWAFFKTVVDILDSQSDVIEAAKNVAMECHGLPFLLLTVGRALKVKSKQAWKALKASTDISERTRVNVEASTVTDDSAPRADDVVQAVWRQLVKTLFKNPFDDGARTQVDETLETSSIETCVSILTEYYKDAVHSLQFKSRETEICFLLCCLFPKGCKIDMETLLRYTIGLGIYPESASIEQVRCKVWQNIEDLKSSFLLLEHEGMNVKLHNVAFECALSRVSTLTPHFLNIKSGVDINKLHLHESTGIYITSNGMAGPRIEILLFGNDGDHYKISRAFLETIEELREFLLRNRSALQHNLNLRILHLEYCEFDIRSLDMLTNVEILSFRGSDICELPSELASLHNLRMLDVYNCQKLHIIPAELIQRLHNCRLEELCIGGPKFKQWPFEVARQEGSNGSISQMNLLSFLPIISLYIPSVSNPENFIFPKLQKYEIAINNSGFNHCYPISRALKVANFSLAAVKELFRNVQHLHLDRLMGYQNLIPSSDMIGGLYELTFLSLRGCPDMENIVDMMEQHHAPDLVLSELEELTIEEMSCLKMLCNGCPQRGFLQKLKKMTATKCPSMIFAIPAVQSLEDLRIKNCAKLQEIFRNDGRFHADNTQGYLFSSLRYLELIELPELSCIWSRSLGQVSLQNLKDVQIKGCNRLTSLFSLFLARSLVQLQRLKIHGCSSLKQVVKDDDGGVDEISVDTDFSSAYFPSLTYLEIVDCNTLEYVFQGTTSGQILPRISKVRIENCSKLQAIFQNDRLSPPNEENACLTCLELIELPELSYLWSASHPRLRYVLIQGCHGLTSLFSSSLARSLEQLETLKIRGCRELKQVVSDDDRADDHDISLANPLPSQSWPSLKFVEIADCQAMEYILRINSTDLPQLEELDINGCQQLNQVFGIMDTDVIKLPLLRRLALKRLKNLITFSSGDSPVSLSSLQTLRVEACCKLANFTISFEVSTRVQLEELCLNDVGNYTTVVGREMQPNLEYLTIENNEEIFQIQGGYLFWKLKKLILKELSKLQVIWKDEMRIVTLQNLTHLEVFKCNKLTSIFSLALVQNLRQLTYLKVQACENLEQIISRNQTSSSRVFHLKSDCFPQLTEISIEDCNMLKNLLPFSLVRLPKLKRLMVKDACRLKQIFKREDEEKARPRRKEDEKNIKGEEEIELPQLEELSFQNLPEFLSFTTLGYNFVFPCLRFLDVIKCDKIAMRFISYRSNPPYVCAQIEESLWPYHTGNSDRVETTESEYIKPKLGAIEWRGHEKN